MSFFAVQVKNGQEIEAKEMLKSVLEAMSSVGVKAIYALESFTHVLKDDSLCDEVSEYLDECDVAQYLERKRIKDNLSALRAAHAEISSDSSEEMESLRLCYQKEISRQSKNLKDLQLSKRIYSVMKGYILLELKENFCELPKELWQLVKRVPKVCGIVSPYSIPKEEVEHFFDTIDLTPSIEMNVIQEEANLPQVEEPEIIQEDLDCEKEIVNFKQAQNDGQENDPEWPGEKLPIQKWIQACHLFLHEKKKTLQMPFPLFTYLQKRKGFTCAFLTGKLSIHLPVPGVIRLERSG
ncbi:transcription termination/antitermination NusG family protein [Domibacillus indicus]|uniref:transcription termination/antitermination NusG family protein n=1 Tax=Domibacillus indicus TaxID=1437523 RepID=UPI000617C7FE|nr:transcription termination/antitermination NusG family protein [Domibacillus indicus]